jgi:predicted DNA binding protein
MRFVELVVTPDSGWSAFSGVVGDDPAVRREAIQQLNLMDDESVVMLYELSGDLEHARELMREHFDVTASDMSEVGDTLLVYLRHDPNPMVEGLLAIPKQLGIVIDTPLEFTRDGGLRLTVVGEDDDIRQVVDAIPDPIGHTVERAGTYRPTGERLFAELTERQQELLLIALESGHYDQPRQATYEDLAAELDCTKTTVGEHLRKAEEKVLTGVAPDRSDPQVGDRSSQ